MVYVTLKEYCTISVDWGGTKYGGLTLDWDYDVKEVHLSMPGYVEKALEQFGYDNQGKDKTNHMSTSHPNMEQNRSL